MDRTGCDINWSFGQNVLMQLLFVLFAFCSNVLRRTLCGYPHGCTVSVEFTYSISTYFNSFFCQSIVSY